MKAETNEIAGAERAAILLMSLGEQEASNVLKHMSVRQVQRLGKVMAQMKKISRDQAESVLEVFGSSVDADLHVAGGTPDYLRNVLSGSLGEDRAESIVERIVGDDEEPSGLESLHLMEPRELTDMIHAEHPQIIAIVLATLEQEQAAEVLGKLPMELATDVVERIARMDEVPRSALDELDEIVQQQFKSASSFKAATMGGVKKVADILNLIDKDIEADIFDNLGERDAELSQEIQDQMFVFENLLDVDDRGIQTLLREVSSDFLVLALKGADAPLKDKILGNMSKRAREILESDMEAKGPVRLSEVEAAQKEILNTARRLAEDGNLMLGSGGEDFV
ncbi:MAG: flagellar motor switch protein FliG [Gammaproteobacteria bacterium]|nr:flagellar motor switch protein FliG [Gammaproteobacteria bacterium]